MLPIEIDFNKLGGMVPAIIQDSESREVLMLGFINREAFDLTVETGFVHYWSRSKKRIWMKGESSGHTQAVKEMRIDCDNDTLLIKVVQNGNAACHEGYKSCFFRIIKNSTTEIDGEKIFNPEDVY
jgi:phosphoribosyl-AMP cyclohydrolase